MNIAASIMKTIDVKTVEYLCLLAAEKGYEARNQKRSLDQLKTNIRHWFRDAMEADANTPTTKQ
jgi:hypothetical protein